MDQVKMINKVNIIVATYNGEKYIREQLNSILNGSYQNILITICDDNSRDKTIKIAEEYVKKYPDKIILKKNEHNKGFVLNFLEALQQSKEDYVMFCDQDDVWLECKIELTMNKMQKLEKRFGKETPISVFTDAFVVDDKLDLIHNSFYHMGKLDYNKRDISHLMMENKLLGCTIMVNQGVKNKLYQFPQKARYHDWWIGLIVSSFGKIGYVKEPTLLYRLHEHNIVGNKNFSCYMKNRLGSLKKQKEVLALTEEQAKNFYEIYEDELPREVKKIIYEFAYIGQKNYVMRRVLFLRNQYFKTGLIRNMGVFFLI